MFNKTIALHSGQNIFNIKYCVSPYNRKVAYFKTTIKGEMRL